MCKDVVTVTDAAYNFKVCVIVRSETELFTCYWGNSFLVLTLLNYFTEPTKLDLIIIQYKILRSKILEAEN